MQTYFICTQQDTQPEILKLVNHEARFKNYCSVYRSPDGKYSIFNIPNNKYTREFFISIIDKAENNKREGKCLNIQDVMSILSSINCKINDDVQLEVRFGNNLDKMIKNANPTSIYHFPIDDCYMAVFSADSYRIHFMKEMKKKEEGTKNGV